MRRSYRVGRIVNNKTIYAYRVFQTKGEATKYCMMVFRGTLVKIDEVDDYPNSRFTNNRVLTIRGQNVY